MRGTRHTETWWAVRIDEPGRPPRFQTNNDLTPAVYETREIARDCAGNDWESTDPEPLVGRPVRVTISEV